MTDLLILGGPRDPLRRPNPRYKGTYRMHPRYFDNLPESHEANVLFQWFIHEGGELGIVHDLEPARMLRDFCNSYGQDKNYEIIEASEEGLPSSLGGEFLGYDLSQGLNNSLLWWGLKPAGNSSDDPVSVLSNLVLPVFSEQLNVYGLFSEAPTAIRCREALAALQTLKPNFIEGDNLEKFQEVALYRLP